MNYHNITKCDMKNGEGIRVVLWVSGCKHFCKGCHNPQTWDEESGIEFDDSAKQEIFDELKKEYVEGITFSGGDPFFHKNIKTILEIARQIHNDYPKKTIWCYTGHLWEDIMHEDVIKYIDVLVDGKYNEEMNSPSPLWCGSSNQRIIDVQKSLNQNKVVLY